MTPITLLHDLLFDFTLRTVALGGAILGALAGALGSFAVLRRQSLLGDAISHAALPGIVLAFLLTGSRSTPVLLLGAAIAGWLGTLAVLGIIRGGRLSEDSALGIVLSVFFGAGLVLLTWVQGRPDARQAGLDTFLFGQAATLLPEDVQWLGIVAAGAGLGTLLLWKEFKILTFDPDFARALGLPLRRVELLLSALLVLAIALGLQMAGVVLMSALVVAPAAAARQWTASLRGMVLLAAGFGALSGVLGAMVSASAPGIPTGPTMVLVAGFFVLISLLFAPERGVLADRIRRRRIRREVRADAVLLDLYALARQHTEAGYMHPLGTLQAMAAGERGVVGGLRRLEARRLARREEEGGGWGITAEGEARAQRLLLGGRGGPEEEE
jgi:manganese/zinc/iron transport system permease protein